MVQGAFCHSVILSLLSWSSLPPHGRSVILSFCHSVILVTPLCAAMVIAPTTRPFRHSVILSFCHFVILSFVISRKTRQKQQNMTK